MTKIKKYVNEIDDELCSAKEYAEKYIELKSKNSMQWANKYKIMAQQELEHANTIHDYAVMEIEELNKIFKPTQKMIDKWDKEHEGYVEKSAWIKQMLAM